MLRTLPLLTVPLLAAVLHADIRDDIKKTAEEARQKAVEAGRQAEEELRRTAEEKRRELETRAATELSNARRKVSGAVPTVREGLTNILPSGRQPPSSSDDLVRENNLHIRRMARIDRIAEIAERSKDAALKKKAELLRRLELDRHTRALQELSARGGRR